MNPALISRPCMAISMINRKMAVTSNTSGTGSAKSKRGSSEAKPSPPASLTSLPVKPVRPLTAYTLYFQQRYEQMKKQNPRYPFIDAQKVTSAEWKSVDGSVRQELERKRQDADVQYKEQLKLYKIQLKQTVVLGDVLRLVNLKGKPDLVHGNKKKLSAYNVFVREKVAGRRGSVPDMASLAKEWQSMSEWDKKKYADKAAALNESSSSS